MLLQQLVGKMNTEYIDTLRKEYIENHKREQIREDLIQENHVEKRDVIGYHGREILELLQNADDAYQKSIDQGNRPSEDLIVEISYIDGCLKISNTGTFFDEDGIKAIVQGNNSPKKGKYIGNKGTGFRSILNWASSVRIFSGEFAVEFSKSYAKEIFDTIKDTPQIAKQLQREKTLYIPMLAVPRNIPHDRPIDRTTIEVDVDPKKSQDEYSVRKQLETIDLRILLFLPNVSEISITTDDKHVVYQRSKTDLLIESDFSWSNITLSKVVDNEIEYSEQYKLFTKTIEHAVKENEDDEVFKDIQMAIAVPVKVERTIDYLYSYFPLLDTDAPFNCVMHATYALGDHRNTLTPSQVNKKIGQYQLDFLFSVAEYLSNQDATIAQKILTPKSYHYDLTKIFPVAFSRLALEQYFVSGVSKLKIFKTVNNELISIIDKPKKIDQGFPKCFKGDSFKELLLNVVNEYSLIHLLTGKLGLDLMYKPEDLCNAINRKSKEWSVQERVEVFIWWNKHGDTNYLPKLLKTRYGLKEGAWLTSKKECYFLEGDFDSLVLPKWVKVTVLSDECQRELVKQAEPHLPQAYGDETTRNSSVIREICRTRIFPCLDFKYRDKSHALSLVNSSVTDFSKAVEFVKWIWKYKLQPAKETTESAQKISYKFPSFDGDVTSQDKLYFGSDYGCLLSSHLFSNDYKAFPGLDVFGVSNGESELFQKHFKDFGIVTYPRIELLEIKPSHAYDMQMRGKIEATGVYDYVSSTRIDYCKYILPYIKNLPEVLQNLSMSQVVEWILKDQKLKEYLGYDVYPSSDRALVKYHGNNQHLGTYWDYYNAIDNYILYTFQNTAWIEVNGEKKSPMEVLDAYTSRTNERYKNFLSVLTINDVEAVAKNLKINVEEVRQVLAYFSFPKYVTELSSSSFYGLMLALQETDVLNEDDLLLSRAIYRIIEQPDFNKDFEDSVNKKKFFEEGKLLVKYQGKLQYWPASEAILPSTRIINKKIFPIVEKGIRTNSKNFVRVFGCKEYSSDYEIIPNTAEVSNLNIDFQGYFLEFIKYAKAFSEKNDIIGSVINKLKVTLVNCISIKENGEVLSIDSNYTLLRRSVSDWYIVINVPSYDRNRMSECIENIFANIANTSGFDVSKIGELFRTNDLETRKFLIIKEFGSLDVINEDFGINHIEENFNKTLKALGKSVDEDFNIDFDEFASLENSANLVRFFRSINVELEAFSDAGFVYPIDLRRYWKRQLENVIRDNRTLFMSYLYNKSESDVLLQKNFVRILREFESFADQPIPNSVFFDPMSKLKVKFGDWTAHVPDGISVVDRYEANFAKMNPANLYQDEIGNDESAQVMIYFGAEEAFSKWLALQENKEAKAPIDFGAQVYQRYKDVCPEEVAVSYTERDTISRDNSTRNVSHGVHSIKKSHQQERRLKEIGNSGELLVYNYLCNNYEDVEPRSEAFVQLGIKSAGQAMSGDYDISYKDGNKTIYVEVKTGEGNRIYLSPGELAFAREHADCYRVYYVTGLNTDNPRFSVLADRFWEDDRYTMREIIESIEVTF